VSKTSRPLHHLILVALLIVTGLTASAPGFGGDNAGHQPAGGLSVYLGVLPATMVQGHPKGHAEEAMHGGIPRGPHAYHVIVAIFDAETGERVEDAAVEARVSPVGLSGITRRLEPMEIADTITYGNYFSLPSSDVYRITVTITRRAGVPPVTVEFDYEHRRP
jgi:hypothetical protein